MTEARRYLEEHREFHNLAISTSLVGQMVFAHYFLKKPPAKTAKRVPGLRPPAPYLIAQMVLMSFAFWQKKSLLNSEATAQPIK